MEYLVKKGADINIKDNEGVGVYYYNTNGRLVLTHFYTLKQRFLFTVLFESRVCQG